MVLFTLVEFVAETGIWTVGKAYNLGYWMIWGTPKTEEEKLLEQQNELILQLHTDLQQVNHRLEELEGKEHDPPTDSKCTQSSSASAEDLPSDNLEELKEYLSTDADTENHCLANDSNKNSDLDACTPLQSCEGLPNQTEESPVVPPQEDCKTGTDKSSP
jgi:hypothetical protein